MFGDGGLQIGAHGNEIDNGNDTIDVSGFGGADLAGFSLYGLIEGAGGMSPEYFEQTYKEMMGEHGKDVDVSVMESYIGKDGLFSVIFGDDVVSLTKGDIHQGDNDITGTEGDDIIVGNSGVALAGGVLRVGNNDIDGGGGNDLIIDNNYKGFGKGGVIVEENFNGEIDGGEGNDVIVGNVGNDKITTGPEDPSNPNLSPGDIGGNFPIDFIVYRSLDEVDGYTDTVTDYDGIADADGLDIFFFNGSASAFQTNVFSTPNNGTGFPPDVGGSGLTNFPTVFRFEGLTQVTEVAKANAGTKALSFFAFTTDDSKLYYLKGLTVNSAGSTFTIADITFEEGNTPTVVLGSTGLDDLLSLT